MKILYIGNLQHGGTCLDRMETIGRLGFDVVPFDTYPFTSAGSRISRSYSHRFNRGFLLSPLNDALLRSARTTEFDIVWIDKGVWVFAETVAELRKKSERRLAVHFTPDAQFLQHRSKHFMEGMRHYDIAVTTKPFEVDRYNEAGAREVLLVLQGYAEKFNPQLRNHEIAPSFHSQVSFIGHCQRHYTQRLCAVAGTKLDLRIWGRNWPRYAKYHKWAKAHVNGDGLWGEEYRVALASAQIGIGLLSKYIPETTTTRTFEIPASGALLLAERTDEHLSLFEEDVEAVYFSNDMELCDKITHYAENDTAREQIGLAGRRRCVASGYDATSQLRTIFQKIGEMNG